jgi:hypothetical protein
LTEDFCNYIDDNELIEDEINNIEEEKSSTKKVKKKEETKVELVNKYYS